MTKCVFCQVTTEQEIGVCPHCGAPLKEPYQEDGIAWLIEDNLKGFRGHAALYFLQPAVENRKQDWDNEDDPGKVVISEERYVIVSSAIAMFSGPETLILPADPVTKTVTDWFPIEGVRGCMDHGEALASIGYTIRDWRNG